MDFEQFLQKEKDNILEMWFELIVKTYSGLSTIFLKKKHPFGNPVGVNIKEALTILYEQLLNKEPAENLSDAIDKIVRIRAVQDYSPSEAVAIFFILKHVVREKCADELNSSDAFVTSLLEFESGIDSMVLVAFDTYMACKDQLHKLRFDDFTQKFSGLLRRHKITTDFSDYSVSGPAQTLEKLKK